MRRSGVVAAAQRRTPDPAARCHPPGAVRRARPAQPQLVAGAALLLAEWRVRRVGVDYHVELEGHFYSVPHRFARSEVEVRLTPRAVEIFLKGERIAAHLRASGNHRHTTVPEHMPSSHRRYADSTVHRHSSRAAASIGPATAASCELILERRPHPEQGFRACLGIGLDFRRRYFQRNNRADLVAENARAGTAAGHNCYVLNATNPRVGVAGFFRKRFERDPAV